MPIGVLFEFRGATSRAKYEKSVKLILKGRRKRLADWPVKGLLAHIAGPMPGGWRVIDVWQSRAAFNQFGKKLKPVLKKIGMQGARPKNFSPHQISSNPSSVLLASTEQRSSALPKCPLSGLKRTCRFALHMSAFDPKRTSSASRFGSRSDAANWRTHVLYRGRSAIKAPHPSLNRRITALGLERWPQHKDRRLGG